MSTDVAITIGDLGKAVGVNPKTIRYYEEIGLLPKPSRTEAGYRLYGRETTDLLRFIKKAQDLGLSLSEIKELAEIRADGNLPCSHLCSLLEAKVDELGGRIQEMKKLRAEMSQMLKDWENLAEDAPAAVICPHIEGRDVEKTKGISRSETGGTRSRKPGKGNNR